MPTPPTGQAIAPPPPFPPSAALAVWGMDEDAAAVVACVTARAPKWLEEPFLNTWNPAWRPFVRTTLETVVDEAVGGWPCPWQGVIVRVHLAGDAENPVPARRHPALFRGMAGARWAEAALEDAATELHHRLPHAPALLAFSKSHVSEGEAFVRVPASLTSARGAAIVELDRESLGRFAPGYWSAQAWGNVWSTLAHQRLLRDAVLADPAGQRAVAGLQARWKKAEWEAAWPAASARTGARL